MKTKIICTIVASFFILMFFSCLGKNNAADEKISENLRAAFTTLKGGDISELSGRYSELCSVDYGGYNSYQKIEKIALEINNDGTYCFTILDGNKNGIRSRGKISIEQVLNNSFILIHEVDAFTDEHRNLYFEKAYVCSLYPEGLCMQQNWQPDKGIFDSEILKENFWDGAAASQKMFQLDVPLEFILILDNPIDNSVIKINRNRRNFLLKKDNANIDDEDWYRITEESNFRIF